MLERLCKSGPHVPDPTTAAYVRSLRNWEGLPAAAVTNDFPIL